jgi:hypothetical protein
MTDPNTSFVASRLAKRVVNTQVDIQPICFDDVPTPGGLLDCLSEHLQGGETHYTARPGIPELRAAIGKEIGKLGGIERGADGVIVTHGDGEALYVTLLGLGLNSQSTLIVHGRCRHGPLLDLLEITAIGMGDEDAVAADASYREIAANVAAMPGAGRSNGIEIVSLGGLLFSGESPVEQLRGSAGSAVLIGNLDSVPGLDHFRLGFVAGPPDIIKRIQTWKQALSICTAGPSQRAALFAIEGRQS